MIAQYSGITLGLSVCGALFINKALEALRELLPGYTESQLNDITSGKSSLYIMALALALKSDP